MIENIWMICGEEPTVDETPYWETINRYLEKMNPKELQDILRNLCRRVFEYMRYWWIVIEGTQLYSTRKELDGKSLYRIHNKGTEIEYRKTIIAY